MYLQKIVIICILSSITGQTAMNQIDCVARDFGNGGTVCVCDEDQCDELPSIEALPPEKYVTYTTNRAGLRFKKTVGDFENSLPHSVNRLVIDSNVKYQKIIGFGGAFTDATGINIKSLTEPVQENLLRSYFAKTGSEYNLCRVPIGGTDFSTHAYSYNDGDVDVDLTRFKLAEEDYLYKLPYIQQAKSMAEDLLLFASAWTAPKWMKTNNAYTGGFLKNSMYQTWANYFIKFLDEYEKEGLDFWGITTGNEPSLAIIPFGKINSVGWFPGQMGKFISEHLGPSLRKSKYKDIKIMALDDQRIFLPLYIYLVFLNKASKGFVDGIAVHWYWDRAAPASFLSQTHNLYPEKFILGTEACHGDKMFERHVILGSWDRAESYAEDIIEDLNHWVTGWVDWNMALDVNGGPTYIDNFVDSPIIVNASGNEFYKQPMYYALSHFSKSLPKGSQRIFLQQCGNQLQAVAFQRDDNGTAIVILNKHNTVIPIVIEDMRKGFINLNITAKSITSVLYW